MSMYDIDGRLKLNISGANIVNNIYTNITTSQNILNIVNDNSLISTNVHTLAYDSSFILSTTTSSNYVQISASFGNNIQSVGEQNLSGSSKKMAREDHVHQANLGFPYEILHNTIQNISSSPSISTIQFQQTRITNSLYQLSSSLDTVTFLQQGIYQVIFRITLDNTSNQKAQALIGLQLNNVIYPNSYAYNDSPGSNTGIITLTSNVMITANANDQIKILAQKVAGNGSFVTVNSGTNLTITKWK